MSSFLHFDHLCEAFREYPVISLHYLAILAFAGYPMERLVIILNLAQEGAIPNDLNPFISLGVLLRDDAGIIRAAIVSQNILPVRVRFGPSHCRYILPGMPPYCRKALPRL